jgi:hypothetical protein
MQKIYNIKRAMFWAASDVGWVVGTALSFMVLSIETAVSF